MECACNTNNGPRMTPQPHMIPGYMGFVPQLKYKFGSSYGLQTNRIFLDPCVNMSPKSVLTDTCPEDCSTGGFLQSVTGFKYGQCGCNDPYSCGRGPEFSGGTNKGHTIQTPRFQTILNHDYAPFCNRFCTRTFEQDQWRDRLLVREQQALDGWRYCYKRQPWDRPERTKPWDGDHGEFRRTQTTLQAPQLKDDIDVYLRGYNGVCGDPRNRIPANCNGNGWGVGGGSNRNNGCDDVAIPVFDKTKARKAEAQQVTAATLLAKKIIEERNLCPPCELYRKHMKGIKKAAKDAGLDGIIKHPVFPTTQGIPMVDYITLNLDETEELNKELMSRAPERYTDGVVEELGELPTLTLHKLQQQMEDKSGLFYAEERGLARVCNPVGSSYVTARPFRCNPIYRCCEAVHSAYQGHIPGQKFLPGENRANASRNALKHMTYRV